MPKRKRAEDELEEQLAHHRKELFRMLKVAKGFERQRMAKRLRDPKSTPEKQARIEKEIIVLKVSIESESRLLNLLVNLVRGRANRPIVAQSLDLQSVANAHLCASLLKVKALAESPKLPDEVKNGVPKPEISEEERAALHNVTSGLYNQTKVREAADKAVADICRALHVPLPDKKGKLKKGDKKCETTARKDPEEQPADRTVRNEPKLTTKKAERGGIEDEEDGSSDDEEWNGLSDKEVEENEVKLMSRFDDRLGSSDNEEYDTANEELDPMEITDVSASEDSEEEVTLDSSVSEEDPEDEENSDEGDSESDGSAVSPPPKTRKESKKATKDKDTQFLPSLMGGYISGSESEASDIDVAPVARKNRRGQRARQAIWEKKFKEQAKHLGKEKSSRDAGWDLKRGAVDASERTPWKQGIKTPFGKRSGDSGAGEQQQGPAEPRRSRAPRKKDDEGPLHPSWEARKKAKEQQQTAAFQGKRVVFD